MDALKRNFRNSLFVLGLVIASAVGWSVYSSYQRNLAREQIYAQHFSPADDLAQIEQAVRDIGFRLVAYTADVLPAAGNRNKLKSAMAEIEAEWADYFESRAINDVDDGLALETKVLKDLQKAQLVFQMIDKAYAQDDLALAKNLIQDEWPFVQGTFLSQLIALQKTHRDTFRHRHDEQLKLFKIFLISQAVIILVSALILILLWNRFIKLIALHDLQSRKAMQSSKLLDLGLMAAGIGHEINNPLAALSLTAQSLKRKLAEKSFDLEAGNKAIGTIQKNAQRIQAIVKSLQVLSRDGSQDPFEKVNVSDLIDDAIMVCQARLKSIDVKVDIQRPETPIFVRGRPSQLAQVVINLVNNSRDAIEALPERWIRITFTADAKFVTWCFTDSGSGIPKEIAARIMEPFFTTKAAGKGTGLGLSVSSDIIKGHYGEIFINHESPHTQFVLKIPRYNSDEETDAKSKVA